MKKLITAIALMSASSTFAGGLTTSETLEKIEDGQNLGRCAGVFTVASVLSQDSSPIQANKLMEFGNGAFLASQLAFTMAGYPAPETNANDNRKSKIDEYLMLKENNLNSGKNSHDGFESKITKDMDFCVSINDKQLAYVQTARALVAMQNQAK